MDKAKYRRGESGHSDGHPSYMSKSSHIREVVSLTDRKFDVTTLPKDMQRVYSHLEEDYGEEYALLFVFTMRTAIELHRAWHMTLLTSKILQQVKDRFKIRMTWNLGVIRLKFRVEDGGYELHRKVPYDYDSEYQDIYMKIAVALVEGHINVHEALIYQTETKSGTHTARSGLFLRDFPGRLILYPMQAATCAVIFFGGDWMDAAIAAVAGFVAGSVEYFLSTVGGEAKILIDIAAGTATGMVGGLFYRFHEPNCLSAIFLGTLYWFFYGTAFVIGLLEIIAGELETGVTRFIAVSVKTFVLCLGASFGMLLVLKNPSATWLESSESCGDINLDTHWWRIPLYLACSASALGQYRFPIILYWRGLAVQLAAYEVQYQVQKYTNEINGAENLDAAASNVTGAATAVVVAIALSYIVDKIRAFYYTKLLLRDSGETSCFGNCTYKVISNFVWLGSTLGIGKKEDLVKLQLEKKLRQQTKELADPQNPRTEIKLAPKEESVLLDTIIGGQSLNIWAILMPAVYQLVPGSMIAKLWFNSIYPPPLIENTSEIEGTDPPLYYTTFEIDAANENIFSNLMIISTSLALGLIVGFAIARTFALILYAILPGRISGKQKRADDRLAGMYTAEDDDPQTDDEEEENDMYDDEPDALAGTGLSGVFAAAAAQRVLKSMRTTTDEESQPVTAATAAAKMVRNLRAKQAARAAAEGETTQASSSVVLLSGAVDKEDEEEKEETADKADSNVISTYEKLSS
mmetsp:Transcript_41195/g.60989  ORF Transcript_41195/g.60989 Transcript_41195/m.60989 type:complete len:748 (-) Transcript_41195:196-2439(-)|eukprot:CAMPEP_0194047648 /NCGR_PEP_ID=MMETSP0009_2-20130614/25087_1 /TAXON_ID=210454 /ORGANISM="Grammatophora oceanica, Strain CCMP 410" /LENGTH=747 /DNA_ID=CAMNT_0038693317 /DNA_START=173 /DNA_END=2416 /DNA_ORIENTATION=+